MKKKLLITFLISFGVLISSLLTMLLFTSSGEHVFPKQENKNYLFGSYHEDLEKNWSEVSIDSSRNILRMNYRLSRSSRTPFVASFIAKDSRTTSLANFHDHNTMRININSNLGMRIPIMITFDYQVGEKKSNGKPFPMVSLATVIEYHEAGNYDIDLANMKIPDWWYRVHRLHRDEVDLSKITNMKGIVIGSCSILKEKVPDFIEIRNIDFYTSNKKTYLSIGLTIMTLTLAVIFVQLWRRIKK